MRQPRRKASRSLQGEIEFDGAPFEVVTPFRFRIKAERNHRQQIAAGRCICKVEDVLGGEEALIGIRRVAGPIGVIAQRKIGSHMCCIASSPNFPSAVKFDEPAPIWLRKSRAPISSTPSVSLVVCTNFR